MAVPQKSGSTGDGPAQKAKAVSPKAGAGNIPKGGATQLKSVTGGPRPQKSGSTGG